MSRFLALAARILVSLALLYLALRGISFTDLASRLRQNSAWGILGWIALALLANLAQIGFAAIRWQEISEISGAPLRVAQAFRYSMIGAFFNQTLPSTIGGDAVRLWLVNRSGAGWRAATYSVLVDRAIGFIALALIVVISLPWSYDLVSDSRGRLALVLIDFAAIMAGIGFLVLGRLTWPWLNAWWPTRHIRACSTVANRAIFDRHRGPIIAALSIAIHFLTIVTAWCAVRAIAAPASFEQTLVLIPPIVLITMLPISIAGWGVREASMVIAFGYAGLTQTDAATVSILFGASFFVAGAIGGVVWIFSTERLAGLPAMRAG